VEVSPLSREMILSETQISIPPIKGGIRFFHHPIPAAPWVCLAANFPSLPFEGELRAYHVSCVCRSGLGPAYLPVAHHRRQVIYQHLILATYLLVQAYAR
jgi:hypothetical protein